MPAAFQLVRHESDREEVFDVFPKSGTYDHYSKSIWYLAHYYDFLFSSHFVMIIEKSKYLSISCVCGLKNISGNIWFLIFFSWVCNKFILISLFIILSSFFHLSSFLEQFFYFFIFKLIFRHHSTQQCKYGQSNVQRSSIRYTFIIYQTVEIEILNWIETVYISLNNLIAKFNKHRLLLLRSIFIPDTIRLSVYSHPHWCLHAFKSYFFQRKTYVRSNWIFKYWYAITKNFYLCVFFYLFLFHLS